MILDDYISACGVSTDKFVKASTFLYTNLLQRGLLSKGVGVYPRSGGTATSNGINLASPGVFDLVSHGTYTHAFDGSTPDGSTGYCDTGIIMLNELANYNCTMAYLSMTNNSPSTDRFLFGVLGNVAQQSINCYPTNKMQAFATGSETSVTVDPISSYQKMFGIIRAHDRLMSLYGDESKIASDNTALTIERHADFKMYLDALNNANTAQFFNNQKCGFAFFGDALNDYEWKTLVKIVYAYKAMLL